MAVLTQLANMQTLMNLYSELEEKLTEVKLTTLFWSSCFGSDVHLSRWTTIKKLLQEVGGRGVRGSGVGGSGVRTFWRTQSLLRPAGLIPTC